MSLKFRVFSKPIELKPETIDKVIWAACSIHNWLRKNDTGNYMPPQSIDREDFNTGNVIPGMWRENTENLQPICHLGTNNYTRTAEEIRRAYVTYFVDENPLP